MAFCYRSILAYRLVTSQYKQAVSNHEAQLEYSKPTVHSVVLSLIRSTMPLCDKVRGRHFKRKESNFLLTILPKLSENLGWPMSQFHVRFFQVTGYHFDA